MLKKPLLKKMLMLQRQTTQMFHVPLKKGVLTKVAVIMILMNKGTQSISWCFILLYFFRAQIRLRFCMEKSTTSTQLLIKSNSNSSSDFSEDRSSCLFWVSKFPYFCLMSFKKENLI